MKDVGMRIRKFREEKNMSVEQLGELIGVSKGFVSKMETGKKPINLENLYKIADALEKEVADLFPRKEKVINPFTKEEEWYYVVQELKEKGFTPDEVLIEIAQKNIEKDNKKNQKS